MYQENKYIWVCMWDQVNIFNTLPKKEAFKHIFLLIVLLKALHKSTHSMEWNNYHY